MAYQIAIPVIISFVISALLGPVVIPFLRKLKVGQTERKELESHQKKTGTPTMGGLMILASIIVTSLFYIKDYPKIVPILFLTVAFGLVGFLDDYLKVVLKRSDGLLAWQKMLLQIVVTAVFAVYMWRYSGVSLAMADSVFRRKILGYRIFRDSGALCGGDRNGQRNEFYGRSGWSCIECDDHGGNLLYGCGSRHGKRDRANHLCRRGRSLGFLLFNVYPASVFMGDTGSLALGGFVAGTAYMLQMPIFILIVGLIYLVEVLSVILQVTYFKRTGRQADLPYGADPPSF